MRSKKPIGNMGGSGHLGKNFKADRESTTKKDCLKNGWTYIKPSSKARQAYNKWLNKKARNCDYISVYDFESEYL